MASFEQSKSQASLQDLESEKAALHTTITSYGEKIEEMEGIISASESKIAAHTHTIDSMNLILEDLSKKKIDLETEIGTLHEQKVSIVSFIDALPDPAEKKKEKENIEKEIQDLTDQKIWIETEFSRTVSSLNQAKEETSTLQKQIELLKSALDSDKIDHVSKKQELDLSLETAKNDHASKITDLSQEKSDLEVNVTNLTALLTTLQENHVCAETNLSELSQKITGLESEYITKKENLDKELEARSSAFDTKETEMIAREGRVSLQESRQENNTDRLRKVKTFLEQKTGVPINVDL